MAIAGRARELRAEGHEVISMAAGEPDFPTPEHIVAAATRAAHDPDNHRYTANPGLPPVREAIAEYTVKYSNVPVDPSQVVVTNGAKQAVFQTFAALLDPGDEVLVPSPYWVTYPAGIELAGGVTVPVDTTPESGFKVTVEALEAARTDRTQAVVFVSPSNPTGGVYTAEETKAIGQWARDNEVWVIADEIYQRLFYSGDVAPSIADTTPNLENYILINGVAKSFAMTGWRVGWMIGPEDVINAAARFQSHATSNVSNISQVAALAAITGDQASVEMMRDAFARRRKVMYEAVTSIPGFECVEPDGAFYVFPDVIGALTDEVPTSAALAELIIDKANVAVVPGESFGTPGYLRLSYALGEDDITRGMSWIADLINTL